MSPEDSSLHKAQKNSCTGVLKQAVIALLHEDSAENFCTSKTSKSKISYSKNMTYFYHMPVVIFSFYGDLLNGYRQNKPWFWAVLPKSAFTVAAQVQLQLTSLGAPVQRKPIDDILLLRHRLFSSGAGLTFPGNSLENMLFVYTLPPPQLSQSQLS